MKRPATVPRMEFEYKSLVAARKAVLKQMQEADKVEKMGVAGDIEETIEKSDNVYTKRKP